MMRSKKSIFLIATILSLCPSALHPQYSHQIAAGFACGFYIHNSENSINLLRDKEFSTMFGINTSWRYSFSQNNLFAVDIFYLRSSADNAINIPYYDSPQPPAYIPGDVKLEEYSADFGLRYTVTDYFNLGGGISVSLVSRTLDVPFVRLEDRVNSTALGFHLVGEILFPVERKGGGFYLFANIKIRYLHSLVLDARGRNLDNYRQSFLYSFASLGIGYTL